MLDLMSPPETFRCAFFACADFTQSQMTWTMEIDFYRPSEFVEIVWEKHTFKSGDFAGQIIPASKQAYCQRGERWSSQNMILSLFCDFTMSQPAKYFFPSECPPNNHNNTSRNQPKSPQNSQKSPEKTYKTPINPQTSPRFSLFPLGICWGTRTSNSSANTWASQPGIW